MPSQRDMDHSHWPVGSESCGGPQGQPETPYSKATKGHFATDMSRCLLCSHACALNQAHVLGLRVPLGLSLAATEV